MRLVVALLAICTLPVASASTSTYGAGGVSVSVTTNDVPHCIASTPLPCPLGYDNNGTLTPGDDTVYLNRSIDRIDVVAPGAPRLDLDMDNARINHTAYATAQDAILAAHGALPPPVRDAFTVDADDGNTNIGFLAPSIDGTKLSDRWNYVDIGLPYTNRTGTTLPNDLGPDDTDEWVPYTIDQARLCGLDDLGDEQAVVCGLLPMQSVESAWPELTPRIITQAHVGNASVASSPTHSSPLMRGRAPLGSTHADAPRTSGPRTEEAVPHPLPVGTSHLAPPDASLRPLEPTPALPSPFSISDTALHPPAPPLYEAAFLALLVPLWLLYHRITGRKVLLHEHRARIQRIVAEQPGCDVSALSRELGLSFKSTAHHVAVLQRGGYVRVTRQANRVLVFSGEERAARRAAALRSPVRQSIVDVVRASPGLRQADLARRLGTGRNVVHAHVRLLVASGVLVRHGARLYLPDEPCAAHLCQLAAAAQVLHAPAPAPST